MKIVGHTSDGKPVVSEVFPFVNNDGIPLEFLIETLHEKGLVISWAHFCLEALRFWNFKTLRTRLKEGFQECSVIPTAEKNSFLEKLDHLLEEIQALARVEDPEPGVETGRIL